MNRIVLKDVFAGFFIRKENSHKIFEIVRFWGELFIVIGEIIFNLFFWYMAAFFRQVKIGVLTLTLEKKQ